MKDTDLAWLAGLWDGEGSIGSRKSSPTNPTVCLQMSMTCRETIEEAARLLRELGTSALGYTYEERAGNHKDAHYIRVNRVADVLRVARALAPYARTKKQHWKLIEEMATIKLSRRRVMPDGRLSRGGAATAPVTQREYEIHEELRRLNYRAKPNEIACGRGGPTGPHRVTRIRRRGNAQPAPL